METFKGSSDLSVMESVQAEWGCSFARSQHFCIVQRKPQSDASFPLTLQPYYYFLQNMRYYENN